MKSSCGPSDAESELESRGPGPELAVSARRRPPCLLDWLLSAQLFHWVRVLVDGLPIPAPPRLLCPFRISLLMSFVMVLTGARYVGHMSTANPWSEVRADGASRSTHIEC